MLKNIASTSSLAYKLNSFDELNSIIGDVQSKMCPLRDPCESAGCSHSCLRFKSQSICKCPEELMLDIDFKTCVALGSSLGANMCQIANGGCDHR